MIVLNIIKKVQYYLLYINFTMSYYEILLYIFKLIYFKITILLYVGKKKEGRQVTKKEKR